MKKFTRKITSLLIAVAAVSTFGNVYAFEVEENYHVQIGDYECYVANGQYYTEIDGETYLVIDLDEGAAEKNNSNISAYANNWQNGSVVDISDGSSYSDTINASKADDCTPIFIGNPTNGYKFTTAYLWGINSYNVNIHYFSYVNNNWFSQNKKLTFYMEILPYNILFTGSASEAITKICVEFYHDGSTGTFPFTYTMQQC